MKNKLTEEQKAKMKANRKPISEKVLPITEKYSICSDGVQYIIRDEKKNPIGYHSYLSHAIKSLCNHVVKDNLDGLLYIAGRMDDIEAIVRDFENLKKVEI